MVGMSAGGFLDEMVIPPFKALLPFPSILVFDLRSLTALYPRTYNCQQTALEFFYSESGFTDSVFLFFPEQVKAGVSGYR